MSEFHKRWAGAMLDLCQNRRANVPLLIPVTGLITDMSRTFRSIQMLCHRQPLSSDVMYKHILIPTDGSDLSREAIEHGIALAKAVGAKVTALTVTEPFHVSAFEPSIVESYKKHVAALATKHLDMAKSAASASNIPCELLRLEHEHPYQAIIESAQARGCDAIVMASHGRRGISAIVLGSETVKVLTHSPVPVVVFRRQKRADFFAAS